MLKNGILHLDKKNRIEVAVHQSIIWSRQTVKDKKGTHRRKLALAGA